MRRKFVAIILVAAAIFAIATTALAGSNWAESNYGGYYYELSDTCGYRDYSSRTSCASKTYKVNSNVDQYKMESKGSVTWVATDTGTAVVSSCTNTGTTGFNLYKIVCYHYVNNVCVGTLTSFAS